MTSSFSKFIILGCSGSGKSTFAKGLQVRTGLPLFHLDNVWWRADRTHIPREEFDAKLADILAGERWIVEGDYSRTYEVRFKACDTVVFLDFPEKVCMEGIAERVGKFRTDIPWQEDTLDDELVRLVRNYATENRPVVYSLIKKYNTKQVLIFRSRAESDRWLQLLPKMM